MSLTLKLSDEQATVLQAKAAAEGLSLDEWIQKLAQPAHQPAKASASQSDQPRRHISEIIRENMSKVPTEIMATMPKDGASEHDHYIYGLPKRNP
ncbi:MAG TPA: hypothetical protein VK604_00225 [Bryobacteraceae bacterium]|nr:hypothetical protein [Bryobacteraceae bacterium]